MVLQQINRTQQDTILSEDDILIDINQQQDWVQA